MILGIERIIESFAPSQTDDGDQASVGGLAVFKTQRISPCNLGKRSGQQQSGTD
jgi:hypothetical protein